MRFRPAAIGAALCSLVLVPVSLFAQQEAPAPPVAPDVTASIIGPDDVPVGRRIILDASASRTIGSNVRYEWYVGSSPEPISTTVDAIFTPDRPGPIEFRLVVRSTVNGETVEDEERLTVTVFTRKVVVIADATITQQKLDVLRRAAASGSTYLRVLQSPVSSASRGGEEALAALLSEQGDVLLDAETIVLWTDGVPTPGLYALLHAVQNNEQLQLSMPLHPLILATDLNMHTVARGGKGIISVLKPRQALVMRPSLLEMLVGAKSAEAFTQQAFQIPSANPLILDTSVVRIPWYYPLTHLTDAMLGAGVSSQTVLLLLVLPVIATILAFLKQIVGITTFGLFTPAIIALSFLALGWEVGVLSLLFILMTGYASRTLMRRLHILYIPKMAIILGIGSFTLLFLVGIAAVFKVYLSHDTIFVLLIMSTLVESFLNVKSEQGLKSAIFAIGQTIVAALLCVMLVQWSPFRALILGYPEVILITVLINILIGRWTGLRISEYFRFREVFKHLVQE